MNAYPRFIVRWVQEPGRHQVIIDVRTGEIVEHFNPSASDEEVRARRDELEAK